ncbi:MAG: ATP-binding protein [Deltaproteobacteria bacterium]|nr:ATP-binding protein [Deltaproteobacteria bacterium]
MTKVKSCRMLSGMPMRRRYLNAQVRRDLARKMVFIAGPRQVGKTTLARSIWGLS